MWTALIALLVASDPDPVTTVHACGAFTAKIASDGIYVSKSPAGPFAKAVGGSQLSAIASTELRAAPLQDGPCRGTASLRLTSGLVVVFAEAFGAPHYDHLVGVVVDPATREVRQRFPDLGEYIELRATPDGFSYVTSSDGEQGGTPPDVPGRGVGAHVGTTFLRIHWLMRETAQGLKRSLDLDTTQRASKLPVMLTRDEFAQVFHYDAKSDELKRIWFKSWGLSDGGVCLMPIISDTDPDVLADVRCSPPKPKK